MTCSLTSGGMQVCRRFSPATLIENQIVSLLKEADAGRRISENRRHSGISAITVTTGKLQGGSEVSDRRRMKELDHENSWLKQR